MSDHCPGCGKFISGNYWLCKICYEIVGKVNGRKGEYEPEDGISNIPDHIPEEQYERYLKECLKEWRKKNK